MTVINRGLEPTDDPDVTKRGLGFRSDPRCVDSGPELTHRDPMPREAKSP